MVLLPVLSWLGSENLFLCQWLQRYAILSSLLGSMYLVVCWGLWYICRFFPQGDIWVYLDSFAFRHPVWTAPFVEDSVIFFPVCISGLLINSQDHMLKSSLFTYSHLCSFIGSSSYMLSCLHWFQQLKMIEKHFMHIVMRFFPHYFLIELFSDLYVTRFYDYARNILLWLLSISFPKGRTGEDAIFFYMTLLYFSLMNFLPREAIRGEHRVAKEVFLALRDLHTF